MGLNQQQLAEGERQRVEQQSACQTLLGWFFLLVFFSLVISYFDNGDRKTSPSSKQTVTAKVVAQRN